MLVGGKGKILEDFIYCLWCQLAMDTFENVLIPPSLSHPNSSHPAGRNEWFWHLGACMMTQGIWSLPLLLYWFIIQKDFFTAKSFGSVRGKGAWNILFSPQDKWYRCGCYLLDGFDSSLPQRASFDVQVHEISSSLPRAASEEREYPRWATRVSGPLVVVNFAASWSLSGLLSPKFEFVWISDVILFQS